MLILLGWLFLPVYLASGVSDVDIEFFSHLPSDELSSCLHTPCRTLKPVFHHSRWVIFAKPTRKRFTNNMKCTWPTQIKSLHTQRELYSTGSCWSSCWVRMGLRWVSSGWRWVFKGWHWFGEAFQIPACWYRQRKLRTWGHDPTQTPTTSSFALQ